jgi:DNA-binding NarL/FixJ family response regulator
LTGVVDERAIREVELRETFSAATRLGDADTLEQVGITLRQDYGYNGLDLANLARGADRRALAAEPCVLAEREIEVLQMVALGMTDAEIAKRLHLAKSTVKTYLARCYEKLGVRDRTGAVVRALGHGWISTEKYLGEGRRST